MTHVPGHVVVPSQSFGVLYPRLTTNTPPPEINGYKVNGQIVGFPILFAISDQDKERLKIGSKKTFDIGFHPYLVPWNDGENDSYIMASDIAVWKDHQIAETEFVKKVKAKHSKFSAIKSIEELHDDLDDLLLEFLDTVNPSFTDEQKIVLKKTRKYVGTSNFKTIYMGGNKLKDSDEIIKWIVENTVPMKKTGFSVNDSQDPAYLEFH